MSTAYILTGVGIAVAITAGLRTLPFAAKSALKDSALLRDLGRWVPLGVIVILALYCVSRIPFSSGQHGLPALAGIAVTVGVHLWRRNAVLSILAGTTTCVLLANWVL